MKWASQGKCILNGFAETHSMSPRQKARGSWDSWVRRRFKTTRKWAGGKHLASAPEFVLSRALARCNSLLLEHRLWRSQCVDGGKQLCHLLLLLLFFPGRQPEVKCVTRPLAARTGQIQVSGVCGITILKRLNKSAGTGYIRSKESLLASLTATNRFYVFYCIVCVTKRGFSGCLSHSYGEHAGVLRKITVLLFCCSRFPGGVSLRSVQKIVQWMCMCWDTQRQHDGQLSRPVVSSMLHVNYAWKHNELIVG